MIMIAFCFTTISTCLCTTCATSTIKSWVENIVSPEYSYNSKANYYEYRHFPDFIDEDTAEQLHQKHSFDMVFNVSWEFGSNSSISESRHLLPPYNYMSALRVNYATHEEMYSLWSRSEVASIEALSIKNEYLVIELTKARLVDLVNEEEEESITDGGGGYSVIKRLYFDVMDRFLGRALGLLSELCCFYRGNGGSYAALLRRHRGAIGDPSLPVEGSRIKAISDPRDYRDAHIILRWLLTLLSNNDSPLQQSSSTAALPGDDNNDYEHDNVRSQPFEPSCERALLIVDMLQSIDDHLHPSGSLTPSQSLLSLLKHPGCYHRARDLLSDIVLQTYLELTLVPLIIKDSESLQRLLERNEQERFDNSSSDDSTNDNSSGGSVNKEAAVTVTVEGNNNEAPAPSLESVDATSSGEPLNNENGDDTDYEYYADADADAYASDVPIRSARVIFHQNSSEIKVNDAHTTHHPQNTNEGSSSNNNGSDEAATTVAAVGVNIYVIQQEVSNTIFQGCSCGNDASKPSKSHGPVSQRRRSDNSGSRRKSPISINNKSSSSRLVYRHIYSIPEKSSSSRNSENSSSSNNSSTSSTSAVTVNEINTYLSLRGEGSFGTVELECVLARNLARPQPVSRPAAATASSASPPVGLLSQYEDYIQEDPAWCPHYKGGHGDSSSSSSSSQEDSSGPLSCLCRPTRSGRFPTTYNGVVLSAGMALSAIDTGTGLSVTEPIGGTDSSSSSSRSSGARVHNEHESPFTVEVVDERRARYLDPDLCSHFTPENIPRMLILGLGAGELHTSLLRHHSCLFVESVEVNAEVFNASMHLMGLKNAICQTKYVSSGDSNSTMTHPSPPGAVHILPVAAAVATKSLHDSRNSSRERSKKKLVPSCRSLVTIEDAFEYINNLSEEVRREHNREAAEEEEEEDHEEGSSNSTSTANTTDISGVQYDFIMFDLFDSDASQWDGEPGQGSSNYAPNKAMSLQHLHSVRKILRPPHGIVYFHLHRDSHYKKYRENIDKVFAKERTAFFKISANNFVLAAALQNFSGMIHKQDEQDKEKEEDGHRDGHIDLHQQINRAPSVSTTGNEKRQATGTSLSHYHQHPCEDQVRFARYVEEYSRSHGYDNHLSLSYRFTLQCRDDDLQ